MKRVFCLLYLSCARVNSVYCIPCVPSCVYTLTARATGWALLHCGQFACLASGRCLCEGEVGGTTPPVRYIDILPSQLNSNRIDDSGSLFKTESYTRDSLEPQASPDWHRLNSWLNFSFLQRIKPPSNLIWNQTFHTDLTL